MNRHYEHVRVEFLLLSGIFVVSGFLKPKMDVEDWRSDKSWAERYMYMFEHRLGCDVTFSLGEEKKIAAHKFVLISKSAVFEAMFCGSLAEKSGNKVIK